MECDKGKISIIMGIYNCADTLTEAIDSIISQTYTNWELIMCDDASTDNTYEIAESYVHKYPKRIILIRNEKNRKLAFSLNRCLEYVTGEYIARMDGDDKSMPERLQMQIDCLSNNPQIDLVGCSMRRFNQEGLADIEYAADKPDYYSLRHSNPFNHATIMARYAVFDKLGGYTVEKRTERCEDYDLWFRFFKEGFTGYNLKEPLYLVREDRNAIKRRTFKSRWNAHKTTLYGYHLLGYPKWWLIKPTVSMILKSITPAFAIEMYRGYQKNKAL